MSGHCCHHLHTHENTRRDPTRTTTIRRQFEAEAFKRFRKLKGRIRKSIVDDDDFGLKTNRGRFEFTRSDEKIAGFMEWLRQAQRDEIIGVQSGVPLSRAGRQAWTHIYIDAAYQRGIAQAGAELRRAGATVDDRWVGAAFNRPIHADRVGLAYVRVYQELEGITDAMDQQISRVLAQGISEGLNPARMASQINNRVDKIGITRARVLARTETINAHAEASLNAYQEAGVEGVDVVAEFLTASDACPECASLQAEVESDGGWTLSRARGVIPVHPNCRCAWAPRVVNGTGIELR